MSHRGAASGYHNYSRGYKALIDLIASNVDDNLALAQPESDLRLTYRSLRERVEVLAGALADAGVRRRDRVALALPNEPSFVVALLAAATVGIAAPADDPRAPVAVVPAESPDGPPRVQRRATAAAGALLDAVPDDTAVVLATGGTTGPPRRVPLTRANLSIAATHVATSLGLGADDVSLCVMPVTHVHGLVTTTLATLATGGTVVIPDGFHPLAFWRIARDYGVTWFTASPTIHQWLLARTADPGGRRPIGAARLRFIRSAGAALPPAVARTLESAFSVPVIDGYEVTEAAGDAGAAQVAILGSDGRAVEAGATGEIALAGPTVARSYDNDAEATRRFFVNGWFRTGDFGYRDRDGRLSLAGVRA